LIINDHFQSTIKIELGQLTFAIRVIAPKSKLKTTKSN